MNIYYDKEVLSDIDEAIPMYGAKEFESPYRSTVPLLSWLKHEQPMVSSILNALEMPADRNLHLEYTVESPRGSGRASHTDLMVLSSGISLAVEAKWTEPRYETVSKWLEQESNPANRREVLSGWLDRLQEHAQYTLRVEDFSDAVYQMVHRAASACVAGSPRLAYLLFEPSPDPRTASIKQIHADLNYLWRLLGSPGSFPFYVVRLQQSPRAAFDAIASLPKGRAATGEQVSAALHGSSPLFTFEEYCVTKTGEES